MPAVSNSIPPISLVSFANWLMARPVRAQYANPDALFEAHQAKRLALGVMIDAEIFKEVSPSTAWCDVHGGRAVGDNIFGYFAAASRAGKCQDALSLTLLSSRRSEHSILTMTRSYDPRTGTVDEDTLKTGSVSLRDMMGYNSRLWNSAQGDRVRARAAALGIALP